MNMRDLQSPPGVWFPTGQDQHGSEHWVIKVPAKVVKDEVKFQLGRWKAEYELIKKDNIDTWRGTAVVAASYMHKRDFWKKWDTYLANMPDDEILSLTKADYETFFADRDQREGVGE